MALSEHQIDRYSRHIILREIGGVGQEKLLSSSVLIVGAGGLGSPAALYLGAAGVGKLGIIDADVVDRSNLQRQILHQTDDIGRLKTESAAATLEAINPDTTVVTFPYRLTSANAMAILADYDFVIDGTDNFPSKFLVADACHFAGKPYSHAGILRFDGQTITVRPGTSACYRCVFPAPPPAGVVPTCSQAGILGAVAGVIGTLQAVEAVKCLLDQGDLFTNRLLVYNALRGSFRTMTVGRSPDCPLCGDEPSITELRDEVQPERCDLAPRTCPSPAPQKEA